MKIWKNIKRRDKRNKSRLYSLLFISISAYANVGQSKIPVTYNVSEDSRYDLNIKVSGDGTKSIRNGKVVHQLKVSEEKVLP